MCIANGPFWHSRKMALYKDGHQEGQDFCMQGAWLQSRHPGNARCKQ